MKQCIKCNSIETSKWYSGPTCRNCYRKNLEKDETRKLKKKISHKKWCESNKEHVAEKYKEWKENNRELYLQYQKEWRFNNKDKIYLEKKEYRNNKYKNDVLYRLSKKIRARIKTALKRNYTSGSAINLLGCSISELKIHLESKFLPNMSWDNYSFYGWHIDHIKPFDAFNLSDPSQQSLACHYTNLQPLWAKDNLSKGAKYE